MTNCSNNYGPYHFPEKLIPLMILNALEGKPLPVYGNGANMRDWLYVEDHARALLPRRRDGRAGETYNIGGHSERTNLEVVETICALLDELAPDARSAPRERLITYRARPAGPRLRYAIDAGKIGRELGWDAAGDLRDRPAPRRCEWYLANRAWWERIRSGVYRGERLGAGA